MGAKDILGHSARGLKHKLQVGTPFNSFLYMCFQCCFRAFLSHLFLDMNIIWQPLPDGIGKYVLLCPSQAGRSVFDASNDKYECLGGCSHAQLKCDGASIELPDSIRCKYEITLNIT